LFQVARETLYILGAYYPETLSLCVFQNMPWIVSTFVNLMWPFVDPITKKKVRFGNSGVNGEVDPDQLLVECGGNLNMSFSSYLAW